MGVPGTLGHAGSGSQLIHGDFNNETPATEMLTPDQIDAILMRHDQVSNIILLVVQKKLLFYL